MRNIGQFASDMTALGLFFVERSVQIFYCFVSQSGRVLFPGICLIWVAQFLGIQFFIVLSYSLFLSISEKLVKIFLLSYLN